MHSSLVCCASVAVQNHACTEIAFARSIFGQALLGIRLRHGQEDKASFAVEAVQFARLEGKVAAHSDQQQLVDDQEAQAQTACLDTRLRRGGARGERSEGARKEAGWAEAVEKVTEGHSAEGKVVVQKIAHESGDQRDLPVRRVWKRRVRHATAEKWQVEEPLAKRRGTGNARWV
eukprot:386894-Pleurochrysis_carterae.AAC.5